MRKHLFPRNFVIGKRRNRSPLPRTAMAQGQYSMGKTSWSTGVCDCCAELLGVCGCLCHTCCLPCAVGGAPTPARPAHT
jgi:hypothetical protein